MRANRIEDCLQRLVNFIDYLKDRDYDICINEAIFPYSDFYDLIKEAKELMDREHQPNRAQERRVANGGANGGAYE